MEENKTHIERHSLTFRILYYWGKIIGINPLSLLENNELVFSYFYLIYDCILCSGYAYFCYGLLLDRLALQLPDETPIAKIVDYIGLITLWLETCLTWLIFGMYPDRLEGIVRGFIKAEEISIKLDISIDYKKHYRIFAIYLALLSIIYVSATAYNNLLLSNVIEFHNILWTLFDWLQIATLNMRILFFWILLIIKKKCHRLNEKLRSLMDNNISTKIELNVDNSSEFIRDSSYNTDLLSNQIYTASQLHRELRDQIARVVGHFALIILCGVATHFIEFSLNVYNVYQYLKGLDRIENISVTYLMKIACWAIIPLMILFITSYVCGSTSNEANQAGNILHALLNDIDNFGDSQKASVFLITSLDLLQNKVKISLLGLFDVDDFFVYSVIATGTMYITIMLQFYD